MGRPRKTTKTAHVAVEGPILPRFPRDTWPKLESDIGIKLTPGMRHKIRVVAHEYAVERLLEVAGSERARLRGRKGKESTTLTKLDAALFKCVEAWGKADKDPAASMALIEFGAEIKVRSGNTIDPDTLKSDIERFACAMRLWWEREVDGVEIIKLEPFDRFVPQIAAIIKSAGGKVTAHGRVYDEYPPSPFQLFMLRLNSILPHDIREPASGDEAFFMNVTQTLSRE
jgi:hypothetical protein